MKNFRWLNGKKNLIEDFHEFEPIYAPIVALILGALLVLIVFV